MASASSSTGPRVLTRRELLSMTFVQLKRHAAELGVKCKFGMTRSGIIRAVVDAFPPPPDKETVETTITGDYASAADSSAVTAAVVTPAIVKDVLSSSKVTEDGGEDSATVALLTVKRPSMEALARQFEKVTGYSMAEFRAKVESERENEDEAEEKSTTRRKLVGKKAANAVLRYFEEATWRFRVNQVFRMCQAQPVEWLYNLLVTFKDPIGVLDATFLGDLCRVLTIGWAPGLALTREQAFDEILERLDGYQLIVGTENDTKPPSNRRQLHLLAAFSIPDLPQRVLFLRQILELFDKIQLLTAFMDTLTLAVADVMKDETCQKLLLASIVLCKYRGENLILHGSTRIRNLAHFLELIAVQVIASEEYIAKKWDTIGTQSGRCHDEWLSSSDDEEDDDELRTGESVADRDYRLMVKQREKIQRRRLKAGMKVAGMVSLKAVRDKALKFGSATGVDEKTITSSRAIQQKYIEEREKRMKEEIRDIDTKERGSALAKALFSSGVMGAKKAQTPEVRGLDEDDEDKDDAVDDVYASEEQSEDMASAALSAPMDLSKYERMARTGVPHKGIGQRMKLDGLTQDQIEEFMSSLTSEMPSAALPPPMPTATDSITSSSTAVAPAPGFSLAEIRARGRRLPAPPIAQVSAVTESLPSSERKSEVATASASSGRSRSDGSGGIVGVPPSVPASASGSRATISAALLAGRRRHLQQATDSKETDSGDAVDGTKKSKSDSTVKKLKRSEPKILGRRLRKHENAGLEWDSANNSVRALSAQMEGLRLGVERLKQEVLERFALAAPQPTAAATVGFADDEKFASSELASSSSRALLEEESDASGTGVDAMDPRRIDALKYVSRFLREDALNFEGVNALIEAMQRMLFSYEEKSERNRRLIFDELLNEKYFKQYRVEFVSKFSENESRFAALLDSLSSLKLTATGVRIDSEHLEGSAPMDVISLIWAFVKPFDEVLELKFAVTQIHAFYDERKAKIDTKKVLRGQSHRGYGAAALHLGIIPLSK